MSSIESSLEGDIQNAGFSLSDTPPAAALEYGSDPVIEQTAEPTAEPTAPVQAQPEQESAPASLQTETPPVEAQSTEGSLNSEDDFQSFLNEVYRGETQNDTPQYEDNEVFELDPRVQVIADFVEKTGRDPLDWFRFQSMDPSNLDDMSVVRMQMSTEYPNLSNQEIDTLLKRKYKIDENLYDEDEVNASRVELKMDAARARNVVSDLRNSFMAPEVQQGYEPQSIVDEAWLRDMYQDVTAMEEIEFDLGNDRSFVFGVDPQYKDTLKRKNAALDTYFDDYVNDDGSWNFDAWNTHRAIMDNLPAIVQSIYRQGISDGQRNVVETASNVSASNPAVGQQQEGNPIAAQVRQAIMEEIGRQPLRFNI